MKITIDKSVVEQALEAIHDLEGEINGYRSSDFPIPEKAKASLRQAIEQAKEQEHVAWMYPDALCDRNCLYLCTKGFTQFPECASFPPQRQPLTDEQIQTIAYKAVDENWDWLRYARAIEAKLKEKNTP